MMNNKLNRALGDWSESAKDVKARIYAATTEGRAEPKRRKPFVLKAAVGATLAIASISGIALLVDRPTAPPTQLEEPNPPVEEQEETFRPFTETYLQIARYELFYTDSSLRTEESATSLALSRAVEVFALFNHLAKFDLKWDDEKRDFYRRNIVTALEHDLKDEQYAAYLNNMYRDLNITQDDYIEQYLLIEREYEMLSSEMFSSHVGTVESDGQAGMYEAGNVQDEFTQKMGVSMDYMNYLAMLSPQRLEPVSPQPSFDWNVKEDDRNYVVEFAQNAAGEYIFVDEEWQSMYFNEELRDFMYTLHYDEELPEFSRYSYPQYKERVTALASDGDARASAMLTLFEILERSIDWELSFEPYKLNDIPKFDEEGLRTHHALTLQLAQYDHYERSEEFDGLYLAYRRADEWLVNAYGLFNHLAQQGYGWNAETRAAYRAQVVDELEEAMQNEYAAAYVNTLLAENDVTLDEYIDYYLLLEKEFDVLQEMMQPGIDGVDENGRYSLQALGMKYRQTIDYSYEAMFEKMYEMSNEEPVVETLDEQPDVSFELNTTFPQELAKNAQGEYVLQYPSFFFISLTDEQKALFEQVRTEQGLPPLARHSIAYYVEAVQAIEQTKVAADLLEQLKLLQNSIQ